MLIGCGTFYILVLPDQLQNNITVFSKVIARLEPEFQVPRVSSFSFILFIYLHIFMSNVSLLPEGKKDHPDGRQFFSDLSMFKNGIKYK